MKLITMLLIALFSLGLKAQEEQSLELTSAQQNIILSDLNNICGDTWCEGDFDLNFQSLTLKKEATKTVYVLEFSAKDTYDNAAPLRQVECEIENIDLIQKIVSTTSGLVITQDLQSELYRKIDACVYEHLYTK
ncbi:MAG: hypothetical protein ACXVAX_07315 [Pseudobdellovibrio sp.]